MSQTHATHPQPNNTAFTESDAQHLRTLAILYYVWGGLSLLGSLFALVYIIVGIGMVAFARSSQSQAAFTQPMPHASNTLMTITSSDASASGSSQGPVVLSHPHAQPQPQPQPHAATTGPQPFQNHGVPTQAGPDDAMIFMGIFFIIMGVFLLIFTAVLGILEIMCGRFLAQQKHRVFCMIMAGVACLGIPLGTALGVFTFVVLGRPEVAAEFAKNAAEKQA